MPGSPTYRSLTLLVLAAVLSVPLSAARGMLHLDGILTVRGDRASTARVIILPTGGIPTSLENVSGPFKLSLPLDGTYLLSFEREGLVTKQVYFDTSVPVERHAESMSFPFKVTLFPEGKDNIYAYAGPVGIVRYYVAENDFSYITDYTLKEGAPMSKRIMDLQKRMEKRGADGLPLDRTEVVYTGTSRTSGDVIGDPTGSVANSGANPMHDSIDKDPDIVATSPTSVAELAFPSITDGDEDVSFSDPLNENGFHLAPAAKPSASASRGTRPAVRTVYRRAPSPPVVLEPLPEEELIVERQRVITIIRITESTGHVTEYRRVVDRHGAVVHFRDGVAVPEQVYRQATGR